MRSASPPRVLASVLAILLLALPACTQGPEEGREPAAGAGAVDAELPEWLIEVSPVPGAEAAPTDLVEVQWSRTRGAQESSGVRLFLDGTDVTAFALPNEGTNTEQPFGPNDENAAEAGGLLAYDPNTELMPVQLDPGEHTARVELVYQPEIGADLEVVDSFEWSFRVQ